MRGGRRGQFTCAACALCMRIVYTCCPKSQFASSGNLIPHNCALNAQTKRRRRSATLRDAAPHWAGKDAARNITLNYPPHALLMRLIFAKRLSARRALKFKLSLINVPFAGSHLVFRFTATRLSQRVRRVRCVQCVHRKYAPSAVDRYGLISGLSSNQT